MTNEQYYITLSEIENYTDRDAYISDIALSSIWDDEERASVPQNRIDALGAIWDAAHRNIKDVAEFAGLSVRQLAYRYGIPQRTAGNWATGTNAPPLWTLLLLQEVVGQYHVDRE